jgi:hypothetical protein
MFNQPQTDAQRLAAAFMDALGQYAQPIQKETGNPEGYYVHGPGGMFGVRGLSQSIISTHTHVLGSLGEVIPIRPSNDMNPLFGYITGWLRSDQQEKNGICDDPLAVGGFKTCIQTTVFGRKEFKTDTLELNHVGQKINRGEFFDLVLENDPLVPQMGGLMQNFRAMNSTQALLAGREMVARVMGVAIAFQRWFCPQVYTGNPGNSSAGGGYKEFPGLDLLISTTKVDALTGQACPSLRSTIMDFAYRAVDSSVAPSIVTTITTMLRILTRKAEMQGLAPVEIAIVMREPLFYALTAVWPCQYNTSGCAVVTAPTNGSTALSLDAESQIRLRDSMRNGKFLIVDGRQVRVITDDCIMEDNHADNGAIPDGGFASDIYFVPLSAMGGSLQTLYWEYYDYNAGTMQTVGDARANFEFWSDNGVFLWHVRPPNNWCLDMIAKVEPRLILRTPQLAGRLTNVTYVPLLHTDDPLPSQDYFVNGGVVSGRPGPSPFSEWNLGGPGFSN